VDSFRGPVKLKKVKEMIVCPQSAKPIYPARRHFASISNRLFVDKARDARLTSNDVHFMDFKRTGVKRSGFGS
jgi:hypothetical protein